MTVCLVLQGDSASPGARERMCSGSRYWRRVHGSYEHLWAGQVADALVDLTGGLAERWNLKDVARSSGQQAGTGGTEARTCRQLLGLKERGLISCSVFSPRAGARELGEFHAFVVSDLRELRGRAGESILLLRVQNPWGRRCWRGPWAEGGEGWSRVEAAAGAELLSQLQDGEFWVDEQEFLQEFDEVTIGFPVTEAGHLQSLYSGKVLRHAQELPGAWVKGQSAGGCRNHSSFPSNPKFWLRVWEPSEVYVAVLQRPRARTADGAQHAAWRRASALGQDSPAVGLHLWKVEKRRVSLPRVLSSPPVAGTVCHAYDREVHLRCELDPGYYLAVPSTFLKDVPGQFLLRVFSSGRVSLSAIRPAAKNADPEEAASGQWETVQLRGCWRAGQTAGGSRNFASYATNPCFPLAVPEGGGPRCVRITLQQHCPDGECHPIGFHVFQEAHWCHGDRPVARQQPPQSFVAPRAPRCSGCSWGGGPLRARKKWRGCSPWGGPRTLRQPGGWQRGLQDRKGRGPGGWARSCQGPRPASGKGWPPGTGADSPVFPPSVEKGLTRGALQKERAALQVWGGAVGAEKGPASLRCRRSACLGECALSARRTRAESPGVGGGGGRCASGRGHGPGSQAPGAQTRLPGPQAARLLGPTSRRGEWPVSQEHAAGRLRGGVHTRPEAALCWGSRVGSGWGPQSGGSRVLREACPGPTTRLSAWGLARADAGVPWPGRWGLGSLRLRGWRVGWG
ncbi:calpain-10 isoform X4 [Rousettus aegyptiacus]|uniref:calpain-10 isoform X4 n=1 Tax=Rousettus aegyptiacus TaxID=9407 RepID=UPI00168D96BC|nr:calpain-10 isoform X4 [Rousettus aegyptiacus]